MNEPCPQCGFVYGLADAEKAPDDIIEAVRVLIERVADLLGDPQRRPDTQTWSPKEYLCHVRDVLLTQRERVLLARRVDRPSVTPMGRDERVEHDGYAHQELADVTRQLNDAALMLAGCLRQLDATAWERTILYNYPESNEQTLRWLAIHALHEVKHHTADIAPSTATIETSWSP